MYVSNAKLAKYQSEKKRDDSSSSVSSSSSAAASTVVNNPQIGLSHAPIRCDVYQRKSADELQFTRDFYFLRFMESLNKLNRADERRAYSRSTAAFLEANNYNLNQCYADTSIASAGLMTTIVQANNTSSMSATNASLCTSRLQLTTAPLAPPKSQSSAHTPPVKMASPRRHLLPMVSKYLELQQQQQPTPTASSSVVEALRAEIVAYMTSEYKPHLLHTAHGIPFIQNKTDIPTHCFISAEAVWWCMERIDEVESERDAICFMQLCTDFDVVRHISNQQRLFVHGFYLHYVVTSDNQHHTLYTKDYCEAGFCDIDGLILGAPPPSPPPPPQQQQQQKV